MRFLAGCTYYIPKRPVETKNTDTVLWTPNFSIKTLAANENLEILTEHYYNPRHDEFVTKTDELLKKNVLNTITARELMRRKKDNKFIIENFLLPQTVNMLYSAPGEYKSLVTLDICLSIITGSPWLGLKTKQGKVLLCDNENSESELRNRLVALINGHKWRRKRSLVNLNFAIRKGTLENTKFVTELHDYIHDNEVSLIVFDTFRRFSSAKENSSDEINETYSIFRKIINNSYTSILFLHHARKEGETYRGSVDILGQVDAAYRMEKQKNPKDFQIVCEKSRSGEIDKIQGSIEWDKENEITTISRHDLQEIESEDRYAKFNKVRLWTLTVIAKIVPMAGNVFVRAELKKELEAENMDRVVGERMSRATFDRVLDYLVRRKYLVKTGNKGEYRRLFSFDGVGYLPQGGMN